MGKCYGLVGIVFVSMFLKCFSLLLVFVLMKKVLVKGSSVFSFLVWISSLVLLVRLILLRIS